MTCLSWSAIESPQKEARLFWRDAVHGVRNKAPERPDISSVLQQRSEHGPCGVSLKPSEIMDELSALCRWITDRHKLYGLVVR